MNKKEDIFIVRQVLNGDTQAYRLLVERHQKNVFNIVYRITLNKEDSEEIAQDVFVKVYKLLVSFKGESKFSTWLYRIAYNAAISAQRKKKISWVPIQEELLEEDTETEFFNDVEALEALKLKHLPMALKELSNEEQLLITMYYQQNLSIADVADITQMSKSNVKIKLFRARKRLYSYLSTLTSLLNNKV